MSSKLRIYSTNSVNQSAPNQGHLS
ncbi:Bgt-50116 [Blumeria graminis f. sp. tritici]|uniref:Bgt-50116 n=1 Tax=Blumeria graminis f. sp. tritici TaxID=62690 RepID=A0A9X9QDD0_BLUGR|nr:Bgt-50116 [Blumeria graminis f. sp. tritici]